MKNKLKEKSIKQSIFTGVVIALLIYLSQVDIDEVIIFIKEFFK